jgi:hypothetical protein
MARHTDSDWRDQTADTFDTPNGWTPEYLAARPCTMDESPW